MRALRWGLEIVGVLVLGAVGLLAAPLSQPPVLASIHEGAMVIGEVDRPALSRFQARDGAWFAYRLYPAKDGATRVSLLAGVDHIGLVYQPAALAAIVAAAKQETQGDGSAP